MRYIGKVFSKLKLLNCVKQSNRNTKFMYVINRLKRKNTIIQPIFFHHQNPVKIDYKV